jgi:hypothetical protein
MLLALVADYWALKQLCDYLLGGKLSPRGGLNSITVPFIDPDPYQEF